MSEIISLKPSCVLNETDAKEVVLLQVWCGTSTESRGITKLGHA